MAKTRYTIGYVNEATLIPLRGETLIVAKVMEAEMGGAPLTRGQIEGLIRIIADAQSFGKYVNIDKVRDELVSSGFLEVAMI